MSLSDRLQAARNQRPAGQSYVPPPEVALPDDFYDDLPRAAAKEPSSCTRSRGRSSRRSSTSRRRRWTTTSARR